MLLDTAITRIKNESNDISEEYSREQCIDFLNTAIQQIASLLIASLYAPLAEETLVHNGDSVPKNYMKAAGTYPIKITKGKIEILDDVETVKVRYFKTPDLLTDESTELPFDNDAINEVVVKGAILFALNEKEYDLQQDTALWQALQQAVASGMSVTR